MEKHIADINKRLSELTKLVSQLTTACAEDRVFLKALGGSVEHLYGQVQTLDKQIEANHQMAGTKAQTKATQETKQMTMTEIGALYRKDPVAGRKAMEARGSKIGTETGINPWIQKNTVEQNRIRSIDPELADRMEAQAAHEFAESLR